MEAERLTSSLCRGGSSGKHESSSFVSPQRNLLLDKQEDNPRDSVEENEDRINQEVEKVHVCKNRNTGISEKGSSLSEEFPKNDVITESRKKIIECALNRDRNSEQKGKVNCYDHESLISDESPRSHRSDDRSKVIERALNRVRKSDKLLVRNIDNEFETVNVRETEILANNCAIHLVNQVDDANENEPNIIVKDKGDTVLTIANLDQENKVNAKEELDGGLRDYLATIVKKTVNASDVEERKTPVIKKIIYEENNVAILNDADSQCRKAMAIKDASDKNLDIKRNVEQNDKQLTVLERQVSSLKRGASAGVLVNSQKPRRDMSTGKPSATRVHSAERPTSTRTGSSPRSQIVRGTSSRNTVKKDQSSLTYATTNIHQDSVVGAKEKNNQKISKGCDLDLKLSLKGLNDSDDDIDDHEGNKSPRKVGRSSPRKGLMSTTKAFEAKSVASKKRDSDGSIVKAKGVNSRSDSAERSKTTVKQSLRLKTFSNESIGPDGHRDSSVERPLRRTSSGRKLPGVPTREAKKPVKKSESENSFLSVRKDGSTEYVALDLNSMFVHDQNSQNQGSNSIDKSVISGNIRNMPLSPTEKHSERVEVSMSKSMTRSTTTDAFVSKGPQVEKGGKPPLERKSSRGFISSGKPPSPRAGVSTSPRKIAAATSKGAASPRVSNSPRMNSSPRTRQSSPRTTPGQVRVSQHSPREGKTIITPRGIERRLSAEKIKDKINETSIAKAIQNGSISETGPRRRRTLSGGSLVSPRPGSPVKAKHLSCAVEGTLQTTYIKEEVMRPRFTVQDSCQQMDLQQVIAAFQVKEEGTETKINSSENTEVNEEKEHAMDNTIENMEARSETEVESEKTWMDAERVWLVHKGGFASASQLKGDGHGLPEGRVKIRLDHGGEILEVDEDDVEKANPPQLDRAEDLSLLRYLNESSSLHTVRQRYGGNLIHSYAGPSLVIVNPMQPIQIYSEKVIQMFKGCKQEDMPPHIFASAQIAYREMVNTRHDQSIVLMGRSGSGKTYNVHHILHYLALSAGSATNVLTVDKLNAMTVLLEAFGNSRTILNTSASRFSQLTTMDFDHNGQVVSSSIQILMFEKTRVVRRPEGEPTFHVFYQLLAGVDSKLRSELQLNNLNDPNLFMTPLQKSEDKQRAMQYWAKIHDAMNSMGMTEDEVKCICSVLAAVYHLGVAGAVKGSNNKGQFARPAGAQRAASLLGISVEELARNIFSSPGTATLTRNTSMRNSPADKQSEAHTTAMEALEGFAVGLYSDVFNAIVSMINRSLSSNFRSVASITVLDTPGFQNPATCGRQAGASFEDLCHNYTQEKLQLLFHDLVFTMPQDRYSQENIDCDFEFVTSSPAAMVSLIEKPPQQTLLSMPRPSSYHENKDALYTYDHSSKHGNNIDSHSHDTQHKVKGQGLHSHESKRTVSVSSDVQSKVKCRGHSPQRCHSTSSMQGFSSKIPVKVTSSLKSYQHLYQTGHYHSNTGHQYGDHDEVRTSTPEVREAEKKGLLWILDEEAIFPGATEDSFMDRFFSYHGEHKVKRDSLLRKASSLGNTFILNHFQGTNPVQYNASGWLKVCRENPITKIATQVLQDSKKSNIKELFNSVKAPVGGLVSGSIVGMEGSTSLRRVGSMRRTFMSGTAGLKKRSMCLQVKFQVDTIIETLRKTKCHFIHCVLPQANAGLCELRSAADMTPEKPDDILMNVTLVRSQFRGNEILESVRIHRQGFPDHITFGEFIQKFEGLVPPGSQPTPDMGEKSSVIQIVENLDIDKLNYRIGLSKVFFRAGALNRLESSRDDRVTGRIVAFQAYCRGYTARKQLAKIRVQHMAISCIQKNIRKHYQIRGWDWWKLYVKVKPLLNVHRTEEELHDRELELEQMKTKLDRIEKERNDYKQQMDKLEHRVVELQADLAEENTTATQASEMLETESAERMRLEKDLKDVQGRYNALKRNHDKLELEMSQMRLWQAESLDGEFDEDEVDGGVYKERYERVRKEMAFTRKRVAQQHEEELEQEHSAKKVVEKRLHESMDEADDLRRQLAAAKKKSQKLMSEMQDSKLHLEEQMSRNNDLERKQRKFDTELGKTHEEIRVEKNLRDKVQRERDTLVADQYSLEKEVQRLKGDVDSQDAKYERLQKELGDTLTSTGHKDDHDHAALKRAKADLEAKVIDQEEELDDQAGQIQQLEQTKVRLEMNLEKQRQQIIKDGEEKDQEMEDLRYSTQKKLKQMEALMEEEYEERKLQAQKNRDLEQRLQDLQGQAAQRDKGTEKRLRKDLRKTKALLKDAEVVLNKQRTGEGSKAQVRQLRNQLEDLEYSSSSAIKAKKTMELELADLQQQLEELLKSKQEIENKSMSLLRDKSDVQSQLEENEEDMVDILKKYKMVVQQQTVDQITMNDQLAQIEELTSERDKLKSEVNELSTRLQTLEENSSDKTVVQRLENKVRDLEARLDLETTNKHRLEVQVSRMKEQMDRMTEEKEHLSSAKTHAEDNIKKVQRQLREMREEFSDVQKRELEMAHKYKENENKVVELEGDFDQNQSDLKLAFKRIADLQTALEDGLGSDDDFSDSDIDDDDDSGSDIDTFLAKHNRSPLIGRQRSYDSDTRSRLTSGSSYSTDNPHSPRLTNNVDHSEA